MLTCYEARLLLAYDGRPGTPRKGIPELGFHLAGCAACRSIFEQAPASAGDTQAVDAAARSAAADPDSDLLLASLMATDAPLMPWDGRYALPRHLDDALEWSGGYRAGIEAGPDEILAAEADAEQPHAVSASRTPVSYRALLRNPNFVRLWVGQAISTFGSFFTRIAVPIYVFSVTSSYTQLGFAYFSSVIAPLLFGLVAGVLADRWDRRRTMVATAVANSCVLLILIVCTLLPIPLATKLLSLYALNFVAALLQEMFRPARVAIFADVLAEDELLAANSLDGATTTFGEFMSYPIAAAALFYIGPSIAFAVDALSFLISAILISGVSVATVARAHTGKRGMLAEIAEGIAIAHGLPLVRKIIALSLIIPLFISLLNTLQLPYAVDALRSSQEVGFPALEAAMALGVVVGMLVLGRSGQRASRAQLLAYGIVGYGLAILGQGLVPNIALLLGWAPAASTEPWTFALLLALPCALLSGAANSMINASIRTMLQEQTPRAALGRVFSVVNVVAGVGFACGALLTGVAQGRAALALVLAGALLVLIGVAARWWLAARRAPPLHLASDVYR